MESISPVIVLLNRNTKQFELSETVNDFEIKNMSKSKIIKKCSICGSSSLGHRPMTKKQLCSFRQLVKSCWNRKSLPICDPCRQHLNQLIKLMEEMDQLTVAMEALVKLIKLKMKYQEIARRKSDSGPDYLNDETSLSSNEKEEALILDKHAENLASDDHVNDDVKPLILNYEDDDLDSYEEQRVIKEEIILPPDKRPEITCKKPGPLSKTRKRKRDDCTVLDNVKSEMKDEDMSSFVKVEEENVENWALFSFSDNELDQGVDTEMILPDDNVNNNGIPTNAPLQVAPFTLTLPVTLPDFSQNDQFITETTEAFLPSYYSTGDLHSTSSVQTAKIIRPNTIPPLPTQSAHLFTLGKRFIPDSEAVCPNCGTRSRDLHFCEYCKTRFSDSIKIINVNEMLERAMCTENWKSSLPESRTRTQSSSETEEIVKITVPRKSRRNAVMDEASSSKQTSGSGNEDNNDGESKGDEIQVVSDKLAPAPSNFSPDTKITLQCRTINVGTYQLQAAGLTGFLPVTICKKGIKFVMPHTQFGRKGVKCCIPMKSITRFKIHPHMASLTMQAKFYLDKLRRSLGFSDNPEDANYHYHPHSKNPRQKKITLVSHDNMKDRMPVLKFLIPSPAYTRYARHKVRGVQSGKIIRLTGKPNKTRNLAPGAGSCPGE
ncbi:uncharacterized protein LOC110854989 isoform X2 [Folsomia candida]|uniref:uncharacterized protein LOC110854989 isoform X2 n=1 Tax=Folsomia candida TaxID=158441 RepID=UPI000B907B49|nr:uncharacterized protein LOC110854989 isoform X2 [Folsomia candida]